MKNYTTLQNVILCYIKIELAEIQYNNTITRSWYTLIKYYTLMLIYKRKVYSVGINLQRYSLNNNKKFLLFRHDRRWHFLIPMWFLNQITGNQFSEMNILRMSIEEEVQIHWTISH